MALVLRTSKNKSKADECFQVNLAGSINGQIDDGQGEGTNINDDPSRSRNQRSSLHAATDPECGGGGAGVE
jgi:hypothetical protein